MQLHELSTRVRERVRAHGPRDAARSLAHDAARRLVDVNREIILMANDLRASHVGDVERARSALELRDLDAETYPLLLEMLAGDDEAWRVDVVEARWRRRTPGFVAMEGGRVVGFVYYATAPRAGDAPHPDLEWLGIELGPTDVYTFDIFIPAALRGRGMLMLRLMYERLHALGFRRARGYVYAWRTPALFSYRATGWREVGRIREHRFAGRWVLVGSVVYRLHPFDRAREMRVPGEIARWIEGRARTLAPAPH